MALADIIAAHDPSEKRLTIVNRDEPEPIVRMLKRMVDAEGVSVIENSPDGAAPGNLVLLESDDEKTASLAVSSIADVGDSVLMVNSDLYVTGTRSIDEVDTPDVLTGLADATFNVADKRKMLLIEISRHVESLAHRYGDGRLHAGFQVISRIDDERGTRRVYEGLVSAGVDAHVYGVPAGSVDLPDGVTAHVEEAEELARSWFVVSTDCPADRKAALLAKEVGTNEWSGFWTFEEPLVDRVGRYLRDTYR